MNSRPEVHAARLAIAWSARNSNARLKSFSDPEVDHAQPPGDTEFIPMTANQQAIIDAACEVAVFSSTHHWPMENSPEYFEFAEKLHRLGSLINAAYPSFLRNVAVGRKD